MRASYERFAPTANHRAMSHTDIDAILLDSFSLHDGVWGLVGCDDDRPVSLWSSYHADRCVQRLRESRGRIAAAEWALRDVTARGATSCIANAEHTLAAARADRAVWDAQARRLEAARVKDSFAPKMSPFIELAE